MIDTHYSKLKYQPIDFITLNNLNYLSGNFVKYVSRFYTIERPDIDIDSQKERLLFYLERSKYNIESLKIEVEDLPIYLLRNDFEDWQSELLLKYFIALENQDTYLLDNLIIEIKLM